MFCFSYAAVSSKKRSVQRLYVYRCFIKKYCITQSTKKLNKNRKWANLHRKNVLWKATMSQRHSNYHDFVKTGVRKRGNAGLWNYILFAPLGRLVDAILESNGFWKGSLIHTFLQSINIKAGKMRSGRVSRKTMKMWSEINVKQNVFGMPKWD